MRMCRIFWLAAGCLSAAFADSITTFSDRSAFDVAVGFTTSEGFGLQSCIGLVGPLNNLSHIPSCIATGTIQSGATYSAADVSNLGFNIDSGGGFPSPFLDSLLGNRTSDPLTVTFDSPVPAFGFDTNQLMGSSFDLTINQVGGGKIDKTLAVEPKDDLQFFGFQSSSSDISSVVISGSSPTFGFALDNFTFDGDPSDPLSGAGVPEPGYLSLAAAALLGGALLRKRLNPASGPQ